MPMNNSSKIVLNEINPYSINENVFKMIKDDWFLITAGTQDKFNTMTANWGGLGILWQKKVCFIFVRPTRYTYEFTENNDFFTLSFFDEEYRDALNYCGAHSGKDVDKAAECGLHPVEMEQGAVSFSEACLVLSCKKIYYQDLNPVSFLDAGIDKNYPDKDYHRMYIGEIIKAYAK